MLSSLLDPSFNAYGCIRQGSAVPPHSVRTISLYKDNCVPLYCFQSDTFWDYDSGMSALLIRDETQIKLYYLDRPITLYAGVCFGFYPLEQSSFIQTGSPEAEPVCTVPVPRITSAPDPLEIFTLFRQCGKDGLYFRGERHLPLELVYVEKGTLHNLCNGQDLLLQPSQMLIFDSNQWHMQYAESEVQFLTVSFLWENHDFSPRCNQVIPVPPELQQTLIALLKEYGQILPDREEFLHTQTKLLLLQILRLPNSADKTHKPSPASEQLHKQIIDQALQVVSDRIRSKLTVPELALAVSVSVSQLNTLFQTYLGTAPAKYITRIRLEESKILLSQQQMSVGKVAALLGYSSIQHFSKQFRAWFGCTPTAFAKTRP